MSKAPAAGALEVNFQKRPDPRDHRGMVDRERFRERIRQDVTQARAMLKLDADVELPF